MRISFQRLRKCCWCFSIAALIVYSGCSGEKREVSLRIRQYYVKGEALYKKRCENCHQSDGNGLGQLYPPIAGSDFLLKNSEASICIIRYGRTEPMIVNGKDYNQPMPANPSLTPLEIAELMTYISNSWTNDAGLFDVKKVSAVLDSCAGSP